MSESRENGSQGFKKGLEATHGGGRRHYRIVASKLLPGSMNTRIWESEANRRKVVEIANSIFANSEFDAQGKCTKTGVREPITAFSVDGIGMIDSGETRYRAVRLLEGFDVLTGEPVDGPNASAWLSQFGFTPVQVQPDTIWFECYFVDKKTSLTDRRFGMLLSNEGRPFTDLEYAAQIKALLAGDRENGVEPVKQREIAEALGREGTWVSHINKLNLVPDALLPYLREDQVKTTTFVEFFDLYGAEKAAEMILSQIEAGKGQGAIDYEEAIHEARVAQAEVDALVNSGEGNEASTEGGPTKLDEAAARVQAATKKAAKAKRQQQRGPDRVTSRAVREHAASSAAPNSGGNSGGKVNRVNFANLHDAVTWAAMNSREPKVRDFMNEALKRSGYQPVEPRVDDEGNELPLPSEVASAA